MKNHLYYMRVLLILSLLISCGKEQSEDTSESQSTNNSSFLMISADQFEKEGYRLDTITSSLFPSVIRTNGVIDVPPNSRATISALLGGYIKDFPLLVGESVARGQKLLTIENLEFLELQQQFLENEQRQEYLRLEYLRQKELFDEKISSQKNYMKAHNEYEKVKIQHEGLRKKLIMLDINPEQIRPENISSTAAIYAPISGSVTKIFVNTGMPVTANTPIMEVVNSEHLHLEIRVFEKDVLRIQKGQLIKFRVPEYSEMLFDAEVYLIGQSIGEDRTVMIHAHLEEGVKEKFIPGMYVQADIFLQESMGEALPEEALIDEDDKFYLLEMVHSDETTYQFRKREINPGLVYKGFVQLNSDFAPDKKKQYLVGDITEKFK